MIAATGSKGGRVEGSKSPRPYRWMTWVFGALSVAAAVTFHMYDPTDDLRDCYVIGHAIAVGLGYSLARGWDGRP